MGKTYIYSRTSTSSQDTSNQTVHLRSLFPDAVVVEEVASGIKSRPALERLVQQLQSGDTLVVAALDRLGRRTSEILVLIEDLQKRGVILRSIREGIDYGTIMGKLITQVLCSVAELERNILSERTKLALAAKRKQGIIGGRRPTYSAELISKAKSLRRRGKTLKEVSGRTGISISRIYQLTKDR